MIFEKVEAADKARIAALSAFATKIVREHFDPIIGKAQNDYMLQKFQTAEAITEQLTQGYVYFFVCDDNEHDIGFLAFYPRAQELYLSKFYLVKEQRGNGYAKIMLEFIIDYAQKAGFDRIVLNVNKDNPARFVYEHLGFYKVDEEKNDIGAGFFMDDFVYAYPINRNNEHSSEIL